ncbi:MAG: spermidine/putrescine transporter ATP-binding protein [Clostridiales bacterium]|nr:spermidine/putrescine transporter ATP-binding protein [Clostridiales bacterium]
MSKEIIKFNNVCKTYVTMEGETEALRNINLSIREGEFIAILGPSGCGKTTILSLLAGLISPTSGSITIWNKEVKSTSQNVGYMLQHDYLLNWRTIKQNIMLGLEILKQNTKENRDYALELLNEMNLLPFQNYYAHQLSGGMRQRVALVRTLAIKPYILLLDEPFSALDYTTRLRLEDLVSETLRKRNKTAILVTHDIAEAISMADRIIIMATSPGRIKREIEVPPPLRDPLPFSSRKVPEFQKYFQLIWREMNENENESIQK